MIDDAMVAQVHKLANERLYKEYPTLDMANFEKHPEGSIKLWQVKLILEAYNEVRQRKQSNNRDDESRGSKSVHKVPKK